MRAVLSSATPSPTCWPRPGMRRSEEHTSELQSLQHLVCRLLLEKKEGKLGRPAASVVVRFDAANPPPQCGAEWTCLCLATTTHLSREALVGSRYSLFFKKNPDPTDFSPLPPQRIFPS